MVHIFLFVDNALALNKWGFVSSQGHRITTVQHPGGPALLPLQQPLRTTATDPPPPSPRGGNTDEGLRNGWIAPAWLTTNGPMRKITISIFTTLVKFKYSWIWQTALRHKLTVWNTSSSDNNWSDAFLTKHKLGPSYVVSKRRLPIESLTNHLYIQDTSAACLSAFSSRILWMNSF